MSPLSRVPLSPAPLSQIPQWIQNLPVAERRAVLVLDPRTDRRESLGSAIRGVIGHRTLEALCARDHRTCHGCDAQAACPHAMLYAPAPIAGREGTPPWRLLVNDHGTRVEVAFRTFGRHADELGDVLLQAFSEQVVGGQLDGAAVVAFGGHAGTPAKPLRDWLGAVEAGPPRPVLVVFDSPLELKVEGDILRTAPPLRALLAATARRAATLATSWAPPLFEATAALPGGMLDSANEIDHESIAVRVREVPRVSARHEQPMSFPGLIGAVRYDAVPTELLAWLEVARVLGVGRHTPFGFGAISVWDGSAENQGAT